MSAPECGTLIDRRRVLREMLLFAGSINTAELLGSVAAAARIAEDDPRLDTLMITGTKAGAPAAAYVVGFRTPPARKPPYMLVIHDDAGLTARTREVARRVALAGFRAIAPDLLAPVGGTPVDSDRAREMIARLDDALALAQAREMIAKAAAQSIGNGRVGAIGFGWGGGFVDRLAIAAGSRLSAGVTHGGTVPGPAEIAKAQVPMLIQPGDDTARSWRKTTAFLHAHLDG